MDPTFTQNINFNGFQAEFSMGIMSQDVRIKCSAGDHDHGSSKMKLTDMVDFNWGLRVCPGHLIAIHRSGRYIAYGLKTREHGMVRVLDTVTKEKTLIKGVYGLIYDIAFAFCTAEILLSFVDEEGSVYVYEIIADEAASKSELKHKLVVQLAPPQSHQSTIKNKGSNGGRVTWCPYVPSCGEDEASCAEHSKLLVVLRLGGSAEVLDVGLLARSGPWLHPIQVLMDDTTSTSLKHRDGYIRLDECHSSVVDASFSPDGTALATAGQDGNVKFFQVFLRDDERPRCLHEWRPHDGKALSSLLFLDNINTYGTDSKFWKFAVTGALNNSELKVWSCETWTCTQTIVFHADPRATTPDLYLKARLDATGTFLILTETNNRLLYVLQVRRDDDGQQAAVESVAEFLLPAACISFCVRTATIGGVLYDHNGTSTTTPAATTTTTLLDGLLNTDGNNMMQQQQQQHLNKSDDNDDDDDDDDVDDDNDDGDDDPLDDEDADLSLGDDVHIHMYLMQTKCLQECRLVFRPENIKTDALAITSPTTTTTTNTPPLSMDLKLDDLQTSVQQLIIKQQQQQQQQQQQHKFNASDKNDNFISDVGVASSPHAHLPNTDMLLIAENNCVVDNDVNTEVAVGPNTVVADKIVVVDNLIDIDQATATSTATATTATATATAPLCQMSNPSNSQFNVMERIFASGGSSPSREVQEILLSLSASTSSQSQTHQQQHISNTNNPITTNSGSSSSSSSSSNIPTSSCKNAAMNDETYTSKQFFDSLTKLQQYQQQQQQQQHKDSSVVSSQDWPNIPKVNNIELVQLDQQQQHRRLEMRIEGVEKALRLHTAQLATYTADRQQHLMSNNNNNNSSSSSNTIEEIMAALAIQQQHITALFDKQQRSLDATVQTATTSAVCGVQQSVQQSLQHAIQQAIQTTTSLHAQQPVQPTVVSALIDSTALATVVQQELKCTVVPLVQATFDQLHRSLDTQHTQKLSQLDNLLRSNVQRLFAQCSQNKAVTEALSGALVQMVRPGLDAQYRDFMATSLVPAWEKICEAMFQQIHKTFTQGTQEYCSAMERYCLEQQRQQQQAQQKVDLNGQQMQTQVSCAFSRLEVTLADVVKEEVRAGLTQLLHRVNNSAMNSYGGGGGGESTNDSNNDMGDKQTPTPSVQHLHHQQQQQQVKRLLNRGGRNGICEAFQVALSAAAAASDTALVLYVCERVPVHEVFCSPTTDGCILPQHVLLSLIQQLGADLTQHTNLKHRYLEESLLNLDMKSSIIKEHGPLVLRDLLKQLALFLAAYPTHVSARNMRMLHMVTQSYVLSSSAIVLT